MATGSQPLYIGVGGHVVALDRSTGTELWRTKVKRSQFVTVSVEKDGIYAGAGGELFCLDPATGSIRWQNKLHGLGLNVIAFTGNATAVVLMAAIAAAEAAAVAAAGAGA